MNDQPKIPTDRDTTIPESILPASPETRHRLDDACDMWWTQLNAAQRMAVHLLAKKGYVAVVGAGVWRGGPK